MEVRPIKRDSREDETYAAFYSALEEHFSEATSKVSESKNLFSLGVYDDLFKFIEKAQKDPLSLISVKIDHEVEAIHKMLSGMVNSFLKKHSESIKCSTRINHFNNALYYYIVLKDGANKRPFLKFLFDYESKPISSKFPIVFDFVSEEVFQELANDYDAVKDARVPGSSDSQ